MVVHVIPHLHSTSPHSKLVDSYRWIGESNSDHGVIHLIGNVPWTSCHWPVSFVVEDLLMLASVNCFRPPRKPSASRPLLYHSSIYDIENCVLLVISTRQLCCFTIMYLQSLIKSSLAWESSRHLATPPLVFPKKALWQRSVETPYRRHVHYPNLGSASDWLKQISHEARLIRSFTQIWVMTCRQYGISALFSQTPFREETSSSVAMSAVFSGQRVMCLNFIVGKIWFFITKLTV